jgi:hypothetical protein
MLLGATQIFVLGQESETGALSEEQGEPSRDSIVGAWRTAITRVDCTTGLPLAVPFRGLFTFNSGGTMAEFGANAVVLPTLRSPGHGVWEQGRGRRNYSFTFIFNRYNAAGAFTGTQRGMGTLELGAKGDSWTSNSTVQVFDIDDNQIGSTGCATGVGTRIE